MIDEYGVLLERALRPLMPAWEPVPRRLHAKVTHDVDTIGIPFGFRAALNLATEQRRPFAALRDVAGTFTPVRPSFLRWVEQVAIAASRSNLDSAVYWMAAESRTAQDVGYDPRDPKVTRTMATLARFGVEQGVHPSYRTFDNPTALRSEVERLRRAIPAHVLGGRQHFLRWSPQTWSHWEQIGLQYDSSVGFHDRVGFRAGTCFPFRPWLLREGREARLLEIPLVVMDSTMTNYMSLSVTDSRRRLSLLIDRCRTVGGVFTVLWHNTSFKDRKHGSLYPVVLALLEGADRWQS